MDDRGEIFLKNININNIICVVTKESKRFSKENHGSVV